MQRSRLLLVVAAVLAAAVGGAMAYEYEEFELPSPGTVDKHVTQVIRNQMAKDRETDPTAQFSGFQKGSPLALAAEAEADARLQFRDRAQQSAIAAALLPASDSRIMGALPGLEATVGALGGTTTSDDSGAAAPVAGSSPGGQLTVASGHVASRQLVDDIAGGAVAGTGALPRDPAKWHSMAEAARDRDPRLKITDIQWMLGTGAAEEERARNNTLPAEIPVDPLEDEAMLKWFMEGGGSIVFAAVDGDTSLTRRLVATEATTDNEVVLTLPLRLTICQVSARNIRTRTGYLGDHLKDAFNRKQEWGLALMLLHEHFKEYSGEGSKWGPFIRTLRASALSKRVLREIRGTFAAELARQYEDEAAEFSTWMDREHVCLHHPICQKDPNSIGIGSFSRVDIKWALWVVRRYSMWVTKRTTSKPFLALVPYAHLLRHRRGSGGGTFLELDNTVKVYVGPTAVGEAFTRDAGQLPDSHTFVHYHWISEDENPDNCVRLSLPGGGGSRDDMFWQLDTLRKWRHELGLPPRMSDLWRITDQLHLFGDDEEEQSLLSGRNRQIAGLPLPPDQATPEEQLMLLNGIDNDQAQLMVLGSDQPITAQLYTAPDPGDDARATDAMNDLAEAVEQLHRSVAQGQVDNSTLTVIEKTKQFLTHGILPWRGLDEVDKLLLRKLSLLKECGPVEEQRVHATGPTAGLLCSLRIHIMNETDLEIVCPKAEGPWFQPKCEGEAFNTTMPISLENEQGMLAALRGSLQALLAGYPTTNERDEAELDASAAAPPEKQLGPRVIAAIRLRMREKDMLHSALRWIDAHQALLPNMTFQTTKRHAAIAAKQAADEAAIARRAAILAEGDVKPVVVRVPVSLNDQETVDLEVRETEDYVTVLRNFAAKYRLTQASINALDAEIRRRAPAAPIMLAALSVVVEDGSKKTVAVFQGQTVEERVERFAILRNITDPDTIDRIQSALQVKYDKRVNETVLLVVPVTAPDARALRLEIRQGDQHDLMSTVGDFCAAFGIGQDMVYGLAVEVDKRLPAPVLLQQVTVPGRGQLQLRIGPGDNLEIVIAGFCKAHGLPLENVPVLMKTVRASLNPGSIVL